MNDEAPLGSSRIRDRHVVMVAAVLVAVVLGLQVLSSLVPAVGDFVGLAPVLIGALIVVTLVVLARALRPRRPPAA